MSKRRPKTTFGRCWRNGKYSFAVYEDARKEANKVGYKNKQRGEESFSVDVYICPHCNTYHIGRGPQGRETDAALSRF